MEGNNRKKPKARQPQPASGEGSLANIVTVVISVTIILLVIWFLANKIIDMTSSNSDESAIAVEEESEVSTDQSLSEESSSEVSSEDESSVSTNTTAGGTPIPEPITAGTANWEDPDSWIGKTYQVKDGANVRSGAGTSNGVIEGVSPGEEITVIDAKYADDAIWVKAVFTGEDGTEMEGWIYSYAINPEPVE